jgi:hypothetical protein
MPALSQNLTFQLTNGNTTTNSVELVYPNTTSTALVYVSDRIKGDGYFGGSDGFHTVMWEVTDFVGSVEIQGTLATEPLEVDWSTINLTFPGNVYSVDTTGLASAVGLGISNYNTQTTAIKTYNFVGNFVWLRGRISNFTEGTVNSISINR